MWIVLALGLWLAVSTIAVALCAAAGAGDRLLPASDPAASVVDAVRLTHAA